MHIPRATPGVRVTTLTTLNTDYIISQKVVFHMTTLICDMGLFAEKFTPSPKKKWCWDKIREQRERKQLDTQCTPLYLVFPPGALPGGHTHRSCGIPCGA